MGNSLSDSSATPTPTTWIVQVKEQSQASLAGQAQSQSSQATSSKTFQVGDKAYAIAISNSNRGENAPTLTAQDEEKITKLVTQSLTSQDFFQLEKTALKTPTSSRLEPITFEVASRNQDFIILNENAANSIDRPINTLRILLNDENNEIPDNLAIETLNEITEDLIRIPNITLNPTYQDLLIQAIPLLLQKGVNALNVNIQEKKDGSSVDHAKNALNALVALKAVGRFKEVVSNISKVESNKIRSETINTTFRSTMKTLGSIFRNVDREIAIKSPIQQSLTPIIATIEAEVLRMSIHSLESQLQENKQLLKDPKFTPNEESLRPLSDKTGELEIIANAIQQIIQKNPTKLTKEIKGQAEKIQLEIATQKKLFSSIEMMEYIPKIDSIVNSTKTPQEKASSLGLLLDEMKSELLTQQAFGKVDTPLNPSKIQNSFKVVEEIKSRIAQLQPNQKPSPIRFTDLKIPSSDDEKVQLASQHVLTSPKLAIEIIEKIDPKSNTQYMEILSLALCQLGFRPDQPETLFRTLNLKENMKLRIQFSSAPILKSFIENYIHLYMDAYMDSSITTSRLTASQIDSIKQITSYATMPNFRGLFDSLNNLKIFIYSMYNKFFDLDYSIGPVNTEPTLPKYDEAEDYIKALFNPLLPNRYREEFVYALERGFLFLKKVNILPELVEHLNQLVKENSNQVPNSPFIQKIMDTGRVIFNEGSQVFEIIPPVKISRVEPTPSSHSVEDFQINFDKLVNNKLSDDEIKNFAIEFANSMNAFCLNMLNDIDFISQNIYYEKMIKLADGFVELFVDVENSPDDSVKKRFQTSLSMQKFVYYYELELSKLKNYELLLISDKIVPALDRNASGEFKKFRDEFIKLRDLLGSTIYDPSLNFKGYFNHIAQLKGEVFFPWIGLPSKNVPYAFESKSPMYIIEMLDNVSKNHFSSFAGADIQQQELLYPVDQIFKLTPQPKALLLDLLKASFTENSVTEQILNGKKLDSNLNERDLAHLAKNFMLQSLDADLNVAILDLLLKLNCTKIYDPSTTRTEGDFYLTTGEISSILNQFANKNVPSIPTTDEEQALAAMEQRLSNMTELVEKYPGIRDICCKQSELHGLIVWTIDSSIAQFKIIEDIPQRTIYDSFIKLDKFLNIIEKEKTPDYIELPDDILYNLAKIIAHADQDTLLQLADNNNLKLDTHVNVILRQTILHALEKLRAAPAETPDELQTLIENLRMHDRKEEEKIQALAQEQGQNQDQDLYGPTTPLSSRSLEDLNIEILEPNPPSAENLTAFRNLIKSNFVTNKEVKVELKIGEYLLELIFLPKNLLKNRKIKENEIVFYAEESKPKKLAITSFPDKRTPVEMYGHTHYYLDHHNNPKRIDITKALYAFMREMPKAEPNDETEFIRFQTMIADALIKS